MGIATRIWRYLAAHRRSGQAHHIDTYFPNRQPGSMCVICPTCPEEGFNMDPLWRNRIPAERCVFPSRRFLGPSKLKAIRRYVDRLLIGLDGNFRLQRKSKREDPNDRALASDRAYFADADKLKAYLLTVEDEPPVKSHLDLPSVV